MKTKQAFGIGCYVDGAAGIYATDEIVDFARDCGAKIEHDEDCDHGETCFDSEFAGCEFACDYEDEATDYMNENFPLDYAWWGRNDNGDWGLWPADEETIREAIYCGDLVAISDPSEIDAKRTDCCDGFVYVNDHGNMTLYGRSGEIVWDIV